MNKFMTIAGALTLATAALSATAQPRQIERSETLDGRQARQEMRIQRGIERGQITPWEGRRLMETQREIRRYEVAARSDGRISRREMQELTSMLDDADRRIRESRRDFDRADRDYRAWRG